MKLLQIKKHKKNKKKKKTDGDKEFSDVELNDLEKRKEVSEKRLQEDDEKKVKIISLLDFLSFSPWISFSEIVSG